MSISGSPLARAELAERRHGACELAAPAKRRTPAPAEAIVYNGQILRASVPPRSTLTDALSQPPDEPADKQGFFEGFHVWVSRRSRVATLSATSRAFESVLARHALRRARRADGLRRRVQRLPLRTDHATKAKDDSEGAARTIRERDLGEPAFRRRASTKPREDANARRCRVTCRTRRRRGAAIGARKRKITSNMAVGNMAVGGVFATHGIS